MQSKTLANGLIHQLATDVGPKVWILYDTEKTHAAATGILSHQIRKFSFLTTNVISILLFEV